MEAPSLSVFRDQLLDRRQRLESATAAAEWSGEVRRLLHEVDNALQRLADGTFGVCKACREPIETDRLLADPLVQLCLSHLTSAEQRVLEQDLALASRIQRELLPKPDLRFSGWEAAYRYRPFGPVSGDYCDLIPGSDGEGYFLIGDVAGKGVAAAMLMSHLSAAVRTLVPTGLPLAQIMERASRIFCESTLPTHYATLVCGRASASGEVELCNAGHPPPLLIRLHGGEIERLESTGLPIGMFCDERFASRTVRLSPGDSLLLYTDGLIEAEDERGEAYGIDRLSALASAAARRPAELVDACLKDLEGFRGARGSRDDLTVLAVARS